MPLLPWDALSLRSTAERRQRYFDLLIAGSGLLLASPLLLLLALAIRYDSPGPIFYCAVRVGRDGRAFRLFKLRTMVYDAQQRGPAITYANDPRITRVGRWLRRNKLDELPQLINVVRGEMSLVGPRPEDPRYVLLYTPAQRRILAYRPGITSPASFAYRHEAQLLAGPDWEIRYRQEVLPAKLAIDLAYMARRSLGSDLGLILRSTLVFYGL